MSAETHIVVPTQRDVDPAPADRTGDAVPLLARADFNEPSLFRPDNMLREAGRQKGLPSCACPTVCILDPDGDIVRFARQVLGAEQSPSWACFHTALWEWTADGIRYGVVGCAVGAPFSVLVAEQLFACGCHLLISVASAGQVAHRGPPPYHVLIDRALRDEGTSYHYLPPSRFAEAEPGLLARAEVALATAGIPVARGTSWTTDAPFRETETTIGLRASEGAMVVEMEAAALYAFASARACPVLCLAHVTNQLTCVEGDFVKGVHDGAPVSLEIVSAIARAHFFGDVS